MKTLLLIRRQKSYSLPENRPPSLLLLMGISHIEHPSPSLPQAYNNLPQDSDCIKKSKHKTNNSKLLKNLKLYRCSCGNCKGMPTDEEKTLLPVSTKSFKTFHWVFTGPHIYNPAWSFQLPKPLCFGGFILWNGANWWTNWGWGEITQVWFIQLCHLMLSEIYLRR